MGEKRRLSSITILVLSVMIFVIYVSEIIYRALYVRFLIKTINPEDTEAMLVSMAFLFPVFPWGTYFAMLGTMAGVGWALRRAEGITANLTRGDK